MATSYVTERRNSVTFNVDWPGLGNLGQWDKRSGGLADSDEEKISPAGMGEIPIGGRPTAENVIVSRFFDHAREPAIYALLLAARGVADASSSQDILDQHENPTGHQVTWHGILKSVQLHDADSTSSTGAEIVCEISAGSVVVAS